MPTDTAMITKPCSGQRPIRARRFCAELIDKWGLEFTEAARLLNDCGIYLHHRARYAEAEPLYQRALAILEKALGPEHPHLATGLENYAVLLRAIGRQEEAATMEARAQVIRTKAASSQ